MCQYFKVAWQCLLHCVTSLVAGYHEARSAVATYSSSPTVTVDPEVTVLEGCWCKLCGAAFFTLCVTFVRRLAI
jgi:hypothetical protein